MQIANVGLDIAKHVFQLHATDVLACPQFSFNREYDIRAPNPPPHPRRSRSPAPPPQSPRFWRMAVILTRSVQVRTPRFRGR